MLRNAQMNVSFADIAMPKTGALAIFVAEGKALSGAAADIDKKTTGALKRAMKAAEFKGSKGQILDLISPKGLSASRVVVLGLGKAADIDETTFENAGGRLIAHLDKTPDRVGAAIVDPVKGSSIEEDAAAAHLAFGAKLRSYRFDKYQTKKKVQADKTRLTKMTVMTTVTAKARRLFTPLSRIADGVCLARELVNEPANVLFPAEFAKRAQALSKLGVKVEVLGEKEMTKLGMGALLGVGQGSSRESKLVVMQWMGGKKGEAPVAFIGKGVCFDTGGISLKPGAGMEDMKGDMGGAACVTGLMHALAARKAKANVVGVIGLVENMPDASAQRPGDIVTSADGQTIEVINTDAEGRLVLADAIWYAQDRFDPKFMIDLATLTGAIMVALGQEYAGLFSNDDDLSAQLTASGTAVNEKVWRMPMSDGFDKMINSKFADMKNVGSRYGGSITAAQFLKRFVDGRPWAHIDIAGTAMNSPTTAINASWGSGYGVRLLNRLVADHYEK
jgi:leucyl aminopeptidase